ncbi:hypothetical protein BN1723_012931, partial [Verticillium longisporum]
SSNHRRQPPPIQFGPHHDTYPPASPTRPDLERQLARLGLVQLLQREPGSHPRPSTTAAMSLDPPTYLASLQNNIRQRPIPWDGAVRAGTITEDHLARIRAADKAKKPEARKEVVEADLDGYRLLFVGEQGKPSAIEKAGKNANVIHYVLVLLSDLLQSVPSLSKALLKSGDPYKSFLPLLANSNNTEDPIPLLTATALTKLIASSRDESAATHRALPLLFTYLSGLTKSSDAGLQDIAVQEYSSLLYSRSSRQQFWDQRSETLLYHVLLVMWQLSFEAEDIGDELSDEYDIVLLYTHLLRLSPKEKTTRLIVSTLHNLLESNQKTLLPTAVLARLPALLTNVSGRHMTDPDLLEDLASLKELLEEYAKTKTNFDEYVAEVLSGHLRWSPPHRSQVFWAENARKILDHDKGDIPRRLAEIMKTPWDSDKQVLAIACNDVGALVREVPERRYQLEKLGLKTRVMELMGEADESVRWESLRALGGWLKYSFDG